MDGYTAYKLYLAIKLHFSKESYDVFKTKGRLRATEDSYYKRNDRGIFEGLSYKFKSEKEYIQYIASNFMYDHPNVLYDPYDYGMNYYKEFIKRKQSITRFFEDDLTKVEDYIGITTDCYEIFNLYLKDEIKLESLVILDTLENICDNVSNALIDDRILLVKKSHGFIKFDKQKIATVYVNFLRENRVDG